MKSFRMVKKVFFGKVQIDRWLMTYSLFGVWIQCVKTYQYMYHDFPSTRRQWNFQLMEI